MFHSAMYQLKKQMEVYTASCSSSCADNCTASLNNCSVTCCNFTGCLNGSFASMMTTTTGKLALYSHFLNVSI